MHLRKLWPGAGVAMALLCSPLTTFADVPVATGQCQFVLGFAALGQAIPNVVGNCLDNQAVAANGDAIQHTTRGLLVWRKADNWSAFSDGATTWVNGPNGLVSRPNSDRFAWEAGSGVTDNAESAAEPGAAPCQFVLGFAALAQAIPDVIGHCTDNQQSDSLGNAYQHTTTGTLLWPGSAGVFHYAAFVSGSKTWVEMVDAYARCGLRERDSDTVFVWEFGDFHFQHCAMVEPASRPAGWPTGSPPALQYTLPVERPNHVISWAGWTATLPDDWTVQEVYPPTVGDAHISLSSSTSTAAWFTENFTRIFDIAYLPTPPTGQTAHGQPFWGSATLCASGAVSAGCARDVLGARYGVTFASPSHGRIWPHGVPAQVEHDVDAFFASLVVD